MSKEAKYNNRRSKKVSSAKRLQGKILSRSHSRRSVPATPEATAFLKRRANATAAERRKNDKAGRYSRARRKIEEEKKRISRQQERERSAVRHDRALLRAREERMEESARAEKARLDDREERLLELEYQADRDSVWDEQDEKDRQTEAVGYARQRMYDEWTVANAAGERFDPEPMEVDEDDDIFEDDDSGLYDDDGDDENLFGDDDGDDEL